ncbi:right-handed parallel beta-helix repeat-containing protein [Alteromonas stellipolaris]|uniref:right-handed parallel beta-helix repeat-containing protein n=1 Tax=Alteromonas stellipolaris TaxID=233316 RepID=UPI00071F968B|nr:right-handed parallel beta-helix repeat-containing protein [Alteromonas stellipolaris]ALM90977.1 hypothetical protein AOR13_1947 [Alteromonas stellipolaris LMG 21856]
MESLSMRYRQLFSLFIIALVVVLASCSVSNHPQKSNSVDNQLGAVIQAQLAASKASNETDLTTALSRMKMSKSAKVIISRHNDNIIHLYKTGTLLLVVQNKYRGNEISEKLAYMDDTPSSISTLVSLFPIDAYRILTYASAKNLIDESSLLAIAVENKLDPTIVLDASATGMENSATPLIHSVGLVIYGQDEDSTSEVKYRKVGDNKWLPALELAWEPIYGALSGSIVHLEPDTQYEVEIVVTDYLETKKQYFFDFKTRPDSPPIDPEKIYYLSEIYNGGQLDLEALNIHGDENGYAKIIGDGPVIAASDEFLSAVNIGSQAYIMLENLTIKGGQRYGVYSDKTHHIWIKGCDISEYGNVANDYRGGIGYKSVESTSPINYDSGIYLEKTGVSVIEDCIIENPNGKANHWGFGHPKGPNALQIYAYHPEEVYRGQIIVRNNRFFGTDSNRFNDVIEGRKNAYRTGGFVRDSAIYGNYLAYANDDLIEIDGGQRNVLVYENEMTQGYVGISIAPNMLGPSYVFHNYIHDLGDETGKEWAAIKAGGLLSKPAGKTYILENYIITDRNGIAASSVSSDSTFWVEATNNIIINRLFNNAVGLGIFDKEKSPLSQFTNNVIFNTKIGRPNLDVASDSLLTHPLTTDTVFNYGLKNEPSIALPISDSHLVPNFSRLSDNNSPGTPLAFNIQIKEEQLSSFDNQTQYGNVDVENESSIRLSGNIWYKLPLEYVIEDDTILSLNYEIIGEAEIVGIALETNNSLTASKVIRLSGSQQYGNNLTQLVGYDNYGEITIEAGKYHLGKINYIVFILDNDIEQEENNSSVTFSELRISKKIVGMNNTDEDKDIVIGLTN